MRWQVQLLGGFSARRGGVSHERLPTRFALLLLARLLLEPRRVHGREELAQWLWPDLEPGPSEAGAGDGRGRLRRHLAVLKALLDEPDSPPAFIATRDSVRVNADAFDVDTRRLEACVAAGDKAGAMACYTGPLLPGLVDDWIDEHRSRIDGLLARMDLDPLQASAASAGDRDGDRVLVPYVTRFMGRAAEQASLAGLVQTVRWIVIVGPGGCGKSRLSAHVAESATGFATVRQVRLVDCARPVDIENRIGAALQLEAGDDTMHDRIVAVLSRGPALLVLDNFEQLADEAGEAVLAGVLSQLPQLHLLVTSRRALRHADAHTVVLQPLPVPLEGCGLQEALANPAVAMFVDRARAARVGFHLHQRNLATVVRICRALDGLPLAIELAASRVRHFRVSEIGQALTSGVKVLALRSAQGADASRHASMALSLAWSWRLLSTVQRQALVALAVFREGFTAAQAQEVMPGGDEDALSALLRDSLVHLHGTTAGDGGQRLRLLTSVRDFVQQHDEAGPLLPLTRERHRACFTRLAQRLERAQRGADVEDLSNCLAAMDSGLADGDPAAAVALALALQVHWNVRGAMADAASVLLRVVEQAPCDTPGHFELSCLLPRVLARAGQLGSAQQLAARALEAAGQAPARRAAALVSLLAVRWMAERDAAALFQPATEALQLARAAAPAWHARAAWLLGAVTLNLPLRSSEAAALALFEESEQVCQRSGDSRGVLLAQSGRIGVLVHQRNWVPALALTIQAQAQAVQLGDLATRLQLCSRHSTALEALRRFAEALDVCREHVQLAAQAGQTYELAYALWNQCRPRARLRQPEAACMLAAFSARLWTGRFGPLEAGEERHIARVRRLVRCQVGAARETALWQQGQALTLEAAIALAS
jgi:predicted ATPase